VDKRGWTGRSHHFSDGDDWKKSSVLKEKIEGWHRQLPPWVTPTLVTALCILQYI